MCAVDFRQPSANRQVRRLTGVEAVAVVEGVVVRCQ